jgi:phage tail sheath protein FI
MSAELLSSKVLILEEEPTVRGIPAVSTSVAGVVGVAERGPIGEAVLVTSWEEYVRVFGGFVAGADLPLAALSFFTNQGTQLWVVRTCHYTDTDDRSTATARSARGTMLSAATPTPAEVVGGIGPFTLTPGAQLVVVEGENAPITVTFTAEAGSVRTPGPGPFALADGQVLEIEVDDAPVQTFFVDADDFQNPAAATATELAAALNGRVDGAAASVDGQGHVVLASETSGASSRFHVRGGSANIALAFPTAADPGAGNVLNISAVTVGEIRQLLEAAAPGIRVSLAPVGGVRLRTVAAGATARVQVQAGTAAAFGFDTVQHTGGAGVVTGLLRVEARSPGAWGNRLTVEVSRGAGPDTFDVLVRENGVLREAHRDLQMDASSARYVERIVNDPSRGSALIRIGDLRVPGIMLPAAQPVVLDGGDDGSNGLDDLDFVGSTVGRTGLHALDGVQDLAILFVPGRASAIIHPAILRYCEDDRRGTVFAVLDPPPVTTATAMVAYQTQTAGLEGLTEHGAIYWPRLVIANPNKLVFGPDAGVIAPPSGAVAGVIARTDASRPGGVYEPPAGVEVGRLRGVIGLESNEALDEKKRDLVYPRRINPISRVPGGAHYVDGVRTLKGNGNFPTVAERRGVSFIERSLRTGLQFARHRNNDDALAAQVFRTIKAFLLEQMNLGAFASREPDKAFFVEVSRDAAERFRGELHVAVGLATQKPAEFVIVRIRQDTRALDEQLAISR